MSPTTGYDHRLMHTAAKLADVIGGSTGKISLPLTPRLQEALQDELEARIHAILSTGKSVPPSRRSTLASYQGALRALTDLMRK